MCIGGFLHSIVGQCGCIVNVKFSGSFPGRVLVSPEGVVSSVVGSLTLISSISCCLCILLVSLLFMTLLLFLLMLFLLEWEYSLMIITVGFPYLALGGIL